ncbi:MAG: VWA domain-containing protein, partial [Clostridiaceae bacterium]|nr:VWA domain-containing protein [Clostridiaceae bacterium]
MQNTFIQMAIGMVPAAVFFLLSGLLAKKHMARNLVSCAVFIAAIGGLAVPQLFSQSKEQGSLKNYNKLSLVYAIADEGSVDIAQTLLQDLREDYTDEYALAGARLAFQNKDYSIAKALYHKSVEIYPEVASELQAVAAMCDAETAYYSLTGESDVASIYATHLETLSVTSNEISEAIEKSIPGTDDNAYSKLAKYIIYAEETHKEYLNGKAIDSAETRKQLRKLNSFFEENPGVLDVTQVRLARLKLQILCEDYKAIAEAVSEDSDYNELLIVSELYLNNYIKQSNFSGSFSKENTQKYQMVYDKLNDIYNNSYMDKSREERNEAKSQIKALKTAIKNPALGKMEEGLLKYATEEYALDASKAYLQMAKIEHSLGNETKSVEYIDSSIDTVGDCDDSDYTVPMYELVGIIGDKDNPEKLKEAAVYVEQVLDNNMTVKMSDVSVTESSSEDEDSLVGDFSAQMQTYVSQKRMSVNIVNVDTTDFETNNTVKATVNISNNLYTSADELKAALSVKDCGVEITVFTVEKVDYTSANILLCVDTSGSMAGDKIEKLKSAIKLFAADKAEIENIALVTFDSGINGDYPFGLSVDELTAAVDSIYADGGTAVYHSIIHSLDKFTKGSGVINSMIVMTDGQDGYMASMAEIENYIGSPFKANDITIYTIGFGTDADGSYLNSIATATGGSYLYASNPTASSEVNQLEEFFSGLRAQILN